MIQQLSGTDASFLYMETAETPMHVGSLYLYELPPGYGGDFYQDFKAQIASRMHLFPIFTRKLAQLPFDIDAPLWVKDDNVELDYHIRRHTVPKPGRFEQLQELVGRLHSNFLDRSRPLWEIYIIDGLADGRVAEYTKFHHAGFDGSISMALVQSLYDTTPVPRQVPPPEPSGKKEELDLLNLIGLMYTSPLRQYLSTMQAVPGFLKAWTKLSAIDPVTLKLEPPELPHLAPSTRLNVAITSQRSYAARTVSLKDIKQLAKANGATVNDVVLAMCSGALRRYLRKTHDLPSEALTAFVPMSVREAGNTEYTNQTIGMICSLATNVVKPIKRLHAIHDSALKAKEFTNAIKSAMLGVSSPWGTPPLLYGLMNMLGHYHLADGMRPLANLTISNNIGSPVPLYLAGAKLVSAYPISIPTHGSALNITVQSYCDNLDIGLIACRRALPDIGTVADYIVEALDELKTETAKLPAGPDATATTVTPARLDTTKRPAAAARTKRAPPVTAPAPDTAAQEAKATQDKPKFPHIVAHKNDAASFAQPIPSDTLVGPATAPAAAPPMTKDRDEHPDQAPLPAHDATPTAAEPAMERRK